MRQCGVRPGCITICAGICRMSMLELAHTTLTHSPEVLSGTGPGSYIEPFPYNFQMVAGNPAKKTGGGYSQLDLSIFCEPNRSTVLRISLSVFRAQTTASKTTPMAQSTALHRTIYQKSGAPSSSQKSGSLRAGMAMPTTRRRLGTTLPTRISELD